MIVSLFTRDWSIEIALYRGVLLAGIDLSSFNEDWF